MAQTDERRKGLARQLAELDAELERGRAEMEKRDSAPELEKKFAEEIDRLGGDRAEVSGDLEEKKNTWLRDRQDAETKLQNIRELAKELQEQVRQIRKLGPEGKCPTCGRPVGKGYEALLEQMEDKFQEAKQDGVWWKSRFDQLENRPEDVAALELREREIASQLDDRARKHARCQVAVTELDRLRADAAQRERRRDELAEELAAIPGGYDQALHHQVEGAVRHLRTQETAAARLEETVGRRVEWEA